MLSVLLGELVESVEFTREVTFVRFESLADLFDDLDSLLVGDTGTKGVLSEVTADTDTGGDDHGCLVSGERRAVELGGVHAGDVLGILTVLVVRFNNVIEETSEGSVGIVGASVSTNSGVDILATGEDACFERNTCSILLSVALIPNFLGKSLGESGLVVISGELGEGDKILGVLQPWATVSDTLLGSRLGKFDLAMSVRVSATHLFFS